MATTGCRHDALCADCGLEDIKIEILLSINPSDSHVLKSIYFELFIQNLSLK